MTDLGYPIRGSWYGSYWQLSLVLLSGLEILMVLSALFGVTSWAVTIVVIPCAVIGAYILQSNSTVEVSNDGILFSQFGRQQYTSWDNVVNIRGGRTGGRVQLVSPIGTGIKRRSSFSFVGCDVFWTKRSTARAVRSWLDVNRRS